MSQDATRADAASGGARSAGSRTPLPTLLSRALLQYARDYSIAGKELDGGSSPMLWFWSDVLRYLDVGGMLLVDVPKEARLSRRMVKPIIEGIQRGGGVVIEPGAARGKKIVRLTAAGDAMKQAWAPLMDHALAAWCERLGDTRVATIRKALEGLVSQFDLEHPHFPLGYGAVDDSVTGGCAVPGNPGPPFIPPHGKDWIPVIRPGGDTVSGLPLPALLSQALVEFAMEIELRGAVSLPEAWVLRCLPGEGAPAGEVAATWGDDFKLKAAIERHGLLQEQGGVVTLTPRGRARLGQYEQATAQVEMKWRDAFGDHVVSALRESLQEAAPDLDDDLPEYPIRTWAGGIRVVGADI